VLKLSPADLCHAVLLKKPFMADGWLWELKHDGFRAFVRRSRAEVKLFSRNGRSMANEQGPSPDLLNRVRSDTRQRCRTSSQFLSRRYE